MIHKTADGREMFVSQMEDAHLANHIDFMIKEMNQCKSVATATGSGFITQALYRHNDKALIEQARSRFRKLYERLPLYIMEAVIRGIDVKAKVQGIAERSSRDSSMDAFMDFSDSPVKGLPDRINDSPF